MVCTFIIIEFLMASMESNRTITDDVLKRAFDFYDEVLDNYIIE